MVVRMPEKPEDVIAKQIVDAAIEVHRTLGGPGPLESVYEEALACELAMRGLSVVRQSFVPITYKGRKLATPLRLDLLIGDKVIVECKAVTRYNKIFETQTRTYLKLSKRKLGIVINFGEELVKDGIHRVPNGL